MRPALWVAVVGLVVAAAGAVVVWREGRGGPAEFFIQPKAAAPDPRMARTVYARGEVPQIIVRGRAFEGRELRISLGWSGTSKPIEEAKPARLAPGQFYGLELPAIYPGRYRVILLVDGAAVRELELRITR